MKVNEAQAAARRAALESAAPAATVAGASAGATSPVEPVAPVVPVDRITIDETDGLAAAAARGVDLAATERASRLASLARAIRAGSYRPSAMALAEQMLAAADLDARLARTLR